MIQEKMLELLLLYRIVNSPLDLEHRNKVFFNGKAYDSTKIIDRYKELTEEFLEPYVIDSDPKG
jgi:hypothetical protein